MFCIQCLLTMVTIMPLHDALQHRVHGSLCTMLCKQRPLISCMQYQNSYAKGKVRGSDCALSCNDLQEEFFAHLGILQCSPRGMPVFLHRVNGGKWDLEGSIHLSIMVCVRIH